MFFFFMKLCNRVFQQAGPFWGLSYIGPEGSFMETIAGRGQSGCLLKEDPLAVLYASGEIRLNQAFSLPHPGMVSY